ncbi:MAG: hypothetical protein U5R14_05900 [Gemmatimonadota bacterium]|nr:hypothetical protein [Gemmatimonadota bacterium]
MRLTVESEAEARRPTFTVVLDAQPDSSSGARRCESRTRRVATVNPTTLTFTAGQLGHIEQTVTVTGA